MADEVKATEKKGEIKIESKEEAIKALENLSVIVYSRMKGKGLSLIEKIIPEGSDSLEPNKTLFTSYTSAISNDVSKTVKKALEFLK